MIGLYEKITLPVDILPFWQDGASALDAFHPFPLEAASMRFPLLEDKMSLCSITTTRFTHPEYYIPILGLY